MDTDDPQDDRLIRFVSQQPWAILPSTLAIMRDVLRMRAAGIKFTAEELAERIGAPRRRRVTAPQSGERPPSR
jgi:DNA-binding GntR family transcriptional regulator